MSLIFLTLLLATPLQNGIGPFNPDGCTLFPEGTKADPQQWAHCCFEHDLNYWAGGSKSKRKQADLALRDCILEAGKPLIATLIYSAVNLGHLSPLKFRSKQWGNGWKDRPRFMNLTAEEFDEVTQALRGYDIPEEITSRLLHDLSGYQSEQSGANSN